MQRIIQIRNCLNNTISLLNSIKGCDLQFLKTVLKYSVFHGNIFYHFLDIGSYFNESNNGTHFQRIGTPCYVWSNFPLLSGI